MSPDIYKNLSLVQGYSIQLGSAFKELGYKVNAAKVESIAVFLLRTMGSELRDYHRPEHSIDVSHGQPPIARIASLYHDIVYVQVDPSWKIFLEELLMPMVPSESLSLNVKSILTKTKNRWFRICAIVFGFENEEYLQASGGLNEFLSAVVMFKMLENILSPIDMLKAIACIEATIPFRKTDQAGNTPAKRLKERLSLASDMHKFKLSPTDIEQATQDCRCIVENDLAGFGSDDLKVFLAGTWSVMSENNPALRNTYYLISDYRKAVLGTIGFFQILDPKNMFWSDVASGSEKNARFVQRAVYNLKYGIEYLKAVGVSLCFMGAVAQETGGDTAYEFFSGPMKKSRDHNPTSLGDFLKFPNTANFDSDEEHDVYSALREGRDLRSKFDRKQAPLAAFLYLNLNNAKQFENIYECALSFHKGKIDAKDFLNQFPDKCRKEILEALSKLVQTRQKQILSLV